MTEQQEVKAETSETTTPQTEKGTDGLTYKDDESLFLSGFVASRGFPIRVKCSGAGEEDKVRQLDLETLQGEKLVTLHFPFTNPDKRYNSLHILGLQLVTAMYEQLRPMTPAPMAEIEVRTLAGLMAAVAQGTNKKKHIKAVRIAQRALTSWIEGGPMQPKVSIEKLNEMDEDALVEVDGGEEMSLDIN